MTNASVSFSEEAPPFCPTSASAPTPGRMPVDPGRCASPRPCPVPAARVTFPLAGRLTQQMTRSSTKYTLKRNFVQLILHALEDGRSPPLTSPRRFTDRASPILATLR